jgi:hypothetical protein
MPLLSLHLSESSRRYGSAKNYSGIHSEPSLCLQSWGTVIGGAMLQNTLATRLPSDVSSNFGGAELIYGLIPQIPQLPQEIQTQVRAAFADGLMKMWQVMVGISGIGFLSCLLMREVEMRTALDETFGLQEDTKKEHDTIPTTMGSVMS